MKTSKLSIALASFAIAIASSAAFVACGGDDTNGGGPTPRDGGGTDSTGMMDSNNGDSNMMPDTVIDTGSCVSDAATCNSCYNAMQNMQDPYNACSPATANCVPFNNAMRVPANVPRL